MSWLARSIVNRLRLDDDDEVQHDAVGEKPGLDHLESQLLENEDDDEDVDERQHCNNNQGKGVKEDLNEFTESLTRQLWGVATFLAPPPPPPRPPPLPRRMSGVSLNPEENLDRAASGNESGDSDETGQTGRLSNREENFNRVGSGIGPTELEQSEGMSESEEYYTLEDVAGITDEVLAFAKNIAHHPETWLDFPVSEEDEFDDFNISDAQYKHVLAVEHLAPRLAALRIELCPAHMSEGYFWMVYFILLHSRLNKREADLLSTSQLVQARAMWMQELQKRTKAESDWSGSNFYSKEKAGSPRDYFGASLYRDAHSGNISNKMFPYSPRTHNEEDDFETVKHPIESDEIKFIDKSVIEVHPTSKPNEKEINSGSSIKMKIKDYDDEEDDDDDWLKEDPDLVGYSSITIMGNEEDVSFSDLEDDNDCTMPVKSRMPPK